MLDKLLELLTSDSLMMEIIVGALIGFVPSSIAALLAWFEKRSYQVKRERLLQYSQKELDFLMSWLKAQEEFCSSEEQFDLLKKRTAEKVAVLMNGVDPSLITPAKSADQSINRLPFFRRALLLYKPLNLAGWVYRLVFYFLLIIFLISIPLFEIGVYENVFTWEQVFLDITFLTVFLGIPTFLGRWFAVRSDRRGQAEALDYGRLPASNPLTT